MAKREFLQLAHTFDPKKHGVAGWFLSEKLDGMRCLWDGGISRGRLASDVGWANVEKDARYKTPPVATGLWSRYGKVIHAPDFFLDSLPPAILDGELYLGRGEFQKLVSTIKKINPDPSDWGAVQYMVFDCPRADEVFADGTINNTNFRKTFKGLFENDYIRGDAQIVLQPAPRLGFASRLKWMNGLVRQFETEGTWGIHGQVQLPFKTSDANTRVEETLAGIVEAGGEGVILKSPSNLWVPERSHQILKHKAMHDAEGTVVGYTWGRETDKGSKLLGLMGALVIEQDNGKLLELSGFTDEEREMTWVQDGKLPEGSAREHGSLHPAEVVISEIENPSFPRGSRVTYRYRELTVDGVAKEARYWRKKVAE